MRQVLSIFLSLSLIFLLRFFLFPPTKINYTPDQEISLVATLTSEPKIFGQTQRFEFLGIEVVARRYPEYHYGDKLKISGKTQEGRRLAFPQIEVLKREEGNWFFAKTFKLRQELGAVYQSSLPEPTGSLLGGIVLGIKGDLPQDFYQSLKASGTLHVVVASGMNVILLSGFLMAFLGTFLKRQAAIFISFLGIFFYVVLAGFEPPIIRAAMMAVLTLGAQAFGRQSWGVLSLFLAGYLMLLVKPTLFFDVGFQLSFLATAGLLLIKPVLTFLTKIPLLGEDLATTLAAQIATLPLLFATFGQYSLLSILTNTLVLWTIPFIMGFGGVMGVLGLIFKPFGQILAILVYPFLFYFEKVTVFWGSLNLFAVKLENFPGSLSCGYFLLLTAILLWWYKRKSS